MACHSTLCLGGGSPEWTWAQGCSCSVDTAIIEMIKKSFRPRCDGRLAG